MLSNKQNLSPRESILSGWIFSDSCSGTFIIANTYDEACQIFVDALRMSEIDIKNHPGYYPGCFANYNILAGFTDCRNHVFTIDNLKKYIENRQDFFKVSQVPLNKGLKLMWSCLDG